jgi:hypothetical protein
MVENAHPLAARIHREVLEAGTPCGERLSIQVLRVARGEETVPLGEHLLQAMGASTEGPLEVEVAADDGS